MALMKKIALKDQYVQVPNETAKACQSTLSLQAVGLLVNLWSYDIETWELHKTELYNRFVKNKETSVRNAWDELVAANYIIEFKYRVGKKWEYEYLYRITPFSEEEKEEQLAECVELTGVSSTLDFQDLKKKTSKCTPQNHDISNINKRNINKQNKNKQNKKFVNKEIPQNDLVNIINEFYSEYAPGRWSKEQWKTIANKMAFDLIDDDGIFRKAFDEYSYIKGVWENIAHHHDLKTGKKSFEYNGTEIPYYDWLNE